MTLKRWEHGHRGMIGGQGALIIVKCGLFRVFSVIWELALRLKIPSTS